MQLKQIGAVFLIAFMCTGMFGFVFNTEMITVDAKSYSSIIPGESIVYNTDVDQWEVYNPTKNITGYGILQKRTGPTEQDVDASNIYIPFTDVPNKYIYSTAFKGYSGGYSTLMDTSWNYSPKFISYHNYQDLNPFHLRHYHGFPLMYMSPGGDNADSGNIANVKITTQQSGLVISYWGGISKDVLNDTDHTDWNKDWINYGTAENPNWHSIPRYGGGYGLTEYGYSDNGDPNNEMDFEIRVCVEIYKGGLVQDSELLEKRYNSPKAYIFMFPIAPKTVDDAGNITEMLNGTVIGTSAVDGSAETKKIENLYGMVYAGNNGNAEIGDWHLMKDMSDDYSEAVTSFGALTYTYKLTRLDQNHDAWIYNDNDKLYYPAVRTASGEYVQDTTCSGASYLVFYQQSDNVSTNLKQNWSASDENVNEIKEIDYGNITYPDTSVPYLHVWVPNYGPIQFVDPYDWVIINKSGDNPLNGAQVWDNGERVGAITFWGKKGIRIGADNTNTQDKYFTIPHSQVWWKIPDNVEAYDNYLCTIDLINKTATCEGIIGNPNTPVDYRTSGVVYQMGAYSDIKDGIIPPNEWPDYFDSQQVYNEGEEDDSAILNHTLLITYADYNPQNYGHYDSDVSIYSNIRFYVESTTVSTDPDKKLWSNPMFYLGYYLPDVFGGEVKSYEYTPEKQTESIEIPVYLTHDNGRFILKSTVAYGKSFIINGQEIEVNDGKVTVEVSKGEFKEFTVNGMSVEYIIQYDGSTPIGTKVFLVFTNDQYSKPIPVGGISSEGYDWHDIWELRGWMDATTINVPQPSNPEQSIQIPRGTLIEGDGVWYFSSNIDNISIEHIQKKAFKVDGGVFTLSIAGSIFIFLGISILGLAGLCYYTNQTIPMLGWVAVGGVVLIALAILFAFANV